MRDFVKWLGVSEKAAKVAVWLLIIMIFLILTNTMLESLGFPNYQITYDNLVNINVNKVLDFLIASIMTVLNFYAIVLMVLRIKEVKNIFKYALLYLLLNVILINIFSYVLVQIFIMIYTILFCYLYTNKNKKYILYGIASIIINVLVQGVTYTYRVKFIDFDKLSETTKTILSIDYFIIMGIIILVKEIYLKKRGEEHETTSKPILVWRIQKRRKSSKDDSKKSSK